MLNKDALAKKKTFEKSSKQAALLTLVGVLLVLASIGFSFYQLHKLNDEIVEKKTQSTELDNEIKEQKERLTEARNELEKTELALADFKKSVEEADPVVAETALKQTIKKNPQAKQVIEDTKDLKQSPKALSNQTGTENKLSTDGKTARRHEREGFQALISGDYVKAIKAFESAENAYNGFHNVYELARLLRKNKSQMSDPEKRKEVFQIIVKKYSWKAPRDLWPQVVSIATAE